MVTPPESFKVLFCDTNFECGFRFTAEELQNDTGIEVTACRKEDIAKHLSVADMAIPLGAPLTAELIQNSSLKLIMQYGVGLEGVDIAAATANGTWVSNMPSDATGNAASCAEHAIYLALALLRDQAAMGAAVRARRVGVPLGQSLLGKTALIVGFGNIAKELVPRLEPFGMRLVCVRRSSWAEECAAAAQLLDERAQWDHVHEHLPHADILFLTCAQNEVTKGLVNEEFLRSCKQGVRIVNVARGGLLDYGAVKAALEREHIGGLGLDVQWQEPVDPNDYFASHPKVILTPHIAGVTELSYRAMAKEAARAARRSRKGLPPVRCINQLANESSHDTSG